MIPAYRTTVSSTGSMLFDLVLFFSFYLFILNCAVDFDAIDIIFYTDSFLYGYVGIIISDMSNMLCLHFH